MVVHIHSKTIKKSLRTFRGAVHKNKLTNNKLILFN
nr:MAG TPA: hypothetical protein [Caudoviricetes sp.]